MNHWVDALAVFWFLFCWVGYSQYAKRKSSSVHCLANIMFNYRKEWALQILTRDVRTADMIGIASLEKTTSFFASSSLVIIAALFTALGAADEAVTFLTSLPIHHEVSLVKLELILCGLVLIFIYAFFKTSWSLRQYNFAIAMINALPSSKVELEEEEKVRITTPVAKMLSAAGYHFNCALRSYYFSLAIFSWFISPWLFIIFSTIVALELHRREFRSRVLDHMMIEGREYDIEKDQGIDKKKIAKPETGSKTKPKKKN